MIKIFCNWCDNETTKRYSTAHIVVNESNREIAREYHLCPKCTKELFRLIRKDDVRNV